YRSTEVTRHHPLVKMLEGFQGDKRFASIALEPFSPAEHRAFIAAMVGSDAIDDAFAQSLYAATEGNPYFSKELVLSLVDSGAIVRHASGSLALSSGELVATDALPKTIHQTVTRRIERLPEPLQELLGVASVLGRSFPFRDLALLSGDRERVEEDVERLMADGFVEEERASR